MEDRQFTTMFMAVLVVLVGFTIAILVIANLLYKEDRFSDLRVQKAVAERIKPVGEVYIGEVPASAGAPVSAAAVSQQMAVADLSGEQVYLQVCASCHQAGILNAPKPGDAVAWQTRLAKGKDILYANAINGIGAMPAKGGRVDMSDEAIKAAVDYLLK